MNDILSKKKVFVSHEKNSPIICTYTKRTQLLFGYKRTNIQVRRDALLPTDCFDDRGNLPLMFHDRYRQEYFSANRSMTVVPLAIALTVSFMSAITLLGISAETYTHGMKIVQLYLGGLLGTPIVLYLYLPVFAKLNTMSVYEVYK